MLACLRMLINDNRGDGGSGSKEANEVMKWHVISVEILQSTLYTCH